MTEIFFTVQIAEQARWMESSYELLWLKIILLLCHLLGRKYQT